MRLRGKRGQRNHRIDLKYTEKNVLIGISLKYVSIKTLGLKDAFASTNFCTIPVWLRLAAAVSDVLERNSK